MTISNVVSRTAGVNMGSYWDVVGSGRVNMSSQWDAVILGRTNMSSLRGVVTSGLVKYGSSLGHRLPKLVCTEQQ